MTASDWVYTAQICENLRCITLGLSLFLFLMWLVFHAVIDLESTYSKRGMWRNILICAILCGVAFAFLPSKETIVYYLEHDFQQTEAE